MTRPKRGHGQGSKVQRRKDGRYGASLMVSGRRYYVYGHTAGLAQAKLKALRKAAERGDPLTQPRTTVGEYLTAWLELATPTIATTTAERYAQIVRLYLVPELGAVRLAQLAAADVRRLYATLSEQLSPSTIATVAAILSAALNAAVRDGVLSQNVARHATLPRQVLVERPTLTADTAVQFFAAARSDPYAPLYALLLGSALRIGEVLALRWQDVDLAAGRLAVVRHLIRVDGELVAVPGTKRGRGSTRPLSALARAALVAQLNTLNTSLNTVAPAALVFADEEGKPIRPETVRRHFRRALSRAGLPPLRPHDLRHSVASLLAAEGVSARAVADLLGHKDVRMTLGVYTHGEALGREAAAALGRILPEGLLGVAGDGG